MKAFSIQRFHIWLKFLWQSKRTKLAYLCLVTILVMAAVFIQNILNQQQSTKMSTNTQYMCYTIGLMAFGLLAIYELTRNWISHPEAVYKNLLPISTLEIFLSLFMLTVFVIPILFTIVFIAVDIPFIYLADNLMSTAAEGTIIENNTRYSFIFSRLIWQIQPLYLICASLFIFWMLTIRKYSLFLALLLLIGMLMLSLAVEDFLRYLFLPNGWQPYNNGWILIEDGRQTGQIITQLSSKWSMTMVMALTIIGLFIASYFRLQEGEVKS